MSQLHIRPAALGDFPAVSTLLAELGRPALTPETSDACRPSMRSIIADPETGSLVADLDGTIVGFLSLVFRDHLNYPNAHRAGFPI